MTRQPERCGSRRYDGTRERTARVVLLANTGARPVVGTHPCIRVGTEYLRTSGSPGASGGLPRRQRRARCRLKPGVSHVECARIERLDEVQPDERFRQLLREEEPGGLLLSAGEVTRRAAGDRKLLKPQPGDDDVPG